MHLPSPKRELIRPLATEFQEGLSKDLLLMKRLGNPTSNASEPRIPKRKFWSELEICLAASAQLLPSRSSRYISPLQWTRKALAEVRVDPVALFGAILLLSSLDTTGLRGLECKGDNIGEGGSAAMLASSNDEPIQTDQKIPAIV